MAKELESSQEKLTGKVREYFVEFMEQCKKELNSEIIQGACEQKNPKETIIELLENTFM